VPYSLRERELGSSTRTTFDCRARKPINERDRAYSRLDAEDLRDVVRAYQDACARVIAQYGGYVAKYLGDGILVYFGYPRAHEDDAERAVRAGLGIVGALPRFDDSNARLRGLELAVRVGINTGPVVVGDIIGEGAALQAGVIGETPNVAARLQTLARPNQVVVGPLTRELVGEAFVCEDLGANRLKGIETPVRAWHMVRPRDNESHPHARRRGESLPLVGRQEELGLLLRSWELSRKKQGQVVLVRGRRASASLGWLMPCAEGCRLMSTYGLRPGAPPTTPTARSTLSSSTSSA
jgi:class 3 adenylate cyclase